MTRSASTPDLVLSWPTWGFWSLKECWAFNSGSHACVASSHSIIREDTESGRSLVKKWIDMVSAVTDLGVIVKDIDLEASLYMNSSGPVSPETAFGALSRRGS